MSTPEQDYENRVHRDVAEWAKLYTPIPPLEAAMVVSQIYARGCAAEVLVTTQITGESDLMWATRAGANLGSNYLNNLNNPGWHVYAIREHQR